MSTRRKLRIAKAKFCNSKIFDKCRYFYASLLFAIVWVLCIWPRFSVSEVDSYFLHPVDNMDIFSVILFCSALISWMLHDLRNEREELQHIVATTFPAKYDYRAFDDYAYREALDIRLREREPTQALRLMKVVLRGKHRVRKKHSESSVELAGNKFTSSYLFFANLILVGYITYCVSRAALLNKSVSVLDILRVIFSAVQNEPNVM